ncbi:MAG: hypothetical protein HYT36_03205 [Candidatus Staskawiczbacteria bacterium]|nr:hypothetical protein [Candidatus Staskawiczbacteria bacterium]
MKKFLLILIIICFLSANSAKAVSIKASPSEIKIETASDLTRKEIIIENPGNSVALFELYLDNFSDFVKIKPESFILEGGKSQKVILEIKNKETGVFSTMISVVAKPLSEREFKANAGVKIPLEIRILENKSEFWLASIFKNFEGLFKNQKSLIYIFSIIFILFLLGLLMIKKKKAKV